jgi:hypothetical protein
MRDSREVELVVRAEEALDPPHHKGARERIERGPSNTQMASHICLVGEFFNTIR